MDVFFILAKMAWDWMLSKIGGYPGLVAYFLLALLSTLTVAHVARWVRWWLDGRKERACGQAEEELDAEAVIAEAEYWLRQREWSE